MANTQTVTPSTVNVPATVNPADLMARLEAANARLAAAENANSALAAALELAKKTKLSYDLADYGKGTISVRGMGQFPDSKYLNQWKMIYDLLPGLIKFGEEHSDQIRAKGFAHEAASMQFEQKFGRKYNGSKPTDADKTAWQGFYKTWETQALSDPSLVSTDQQRRIVLGK